MTPDRTDAHRSLIENLSAADGPLSTDAPTATLKNPAWFVERGGRLETRAGRRALHRRLRDELREENPGVRAERRAIVLAGPPGAGKGTTLRQERAEVLPSYLVIDADDFKKKLLTEAMRDGTYESFIKPQSIKDLEERGEQFFPLELASLVHEESSMLATQMRNEALLDGTNIVIDTVLSSPEKAADLGRLLEGAGYDVEVIDVEVPFELSEERIASRWRGDYLNALEKGEGLGGRWVPSEFAREVLDFQDCGPSTLQVETTTSCYRDYFYIWCSHVRD
ncbi:zeta toxin family protein [Corynebacterium xerosis]|uniref:UDP-N-acetylglucosamine kinase n=1 Tax=Corynebacterium xerosis TaxID=1725 RepID=A0A7X9XTY7_9CORY|nr:AAA family ATPase [Corynebacterium xerosis]